ncbi:MAG: chitobiase/beta-hexosaminidase C-terminal domain-containing protein [Streptosporangiales bacterium]|nr:chitobiase/beta-hexosaminidase C-terminal domain-containing protein [Streptosporangiales bacterium]
MVAVFCAAVSLLWFAAAPASAKPRQAQVNASATQVLTWTADDSITAYKSAPTTAVAGPATIVFENSTATGNTTGMPHTLTFDTSTAGYNHDVDVNITASPFDANGGHYEVQVNLTPGKYRYFCAMAGHQMSGELVVTDGGGTTDTTAPTTSAAVTGDKDANGAYVGSATVTVTASDSESGVDSIEYALDNDAYQPYTAPITVNDVGDHIVTYRATDKAGNTSDAKTVSFTVVAPQSQDTTPPDVSATVSGDKDANGAYVGSATVTVAASDSESGVDTVEYALDDAPYATYTAPVRVDQPGHHMVSYRATDKAGNVSDPKTVMFDVAQPQAGDTTPPDVSASVSGDQNTNGEYVGSATVTVTAADTESGVDTVEYALDGDTFKAYTAPLSVTDAGDHTVKYRATDKAGNTSAVKSVSFTVAAPPSGDDTPPDVSGQLTGNQDFAWNYVGTATLTITAKDAGSGVASVEYSLDGAPYAAYSAPVQVSQPGQHTATYRATDKSGNTSDVQTAHFSVVASAK